jgi:chemotaxis signal transduction protein
MTTMARRARREPPGRPDPETLERLLGAWANAPDTAAARPGPDAPPATHLDGRLLRCDIGGGAYAFPLLAVAEVVPYTPPRRLPGQAAETGVAILRGRMLPAVDAAARMDITVSGPPTRMVVLSTNAGDHAVAVSGTHDIVEIDPTRLSDPPTGAAAPAYVAALADIDGEVVVVLDPDRLCAG